jgi:hypothetical protein
MGGSGGAMTIIPDVVLKGNDLYLSFTRTQERNNRTMSYYIDIIDMTPLVKLKLSWLLVVVELRWNGADKRRFKYCN